MNSSFIKTKCISIIDMIKVIKRKLPTPRHYVLDLDLTKTDVRVDLRTYPLVAGQRTYSAKSFPGFHYLLLFTPSTLY